MSIVRAFGRRLLQSPVAWTSFSAFLRLAAGVLLLPLVLRKLNQGDLGMYYVFLRLVAVVPIIDFGFSVSIGRHVSYAMGGAKELRAQGLAEAHGDGPNFAMLWQLLRACQRLYVGLALVTLVLVGVWGTWIVWGSLPGLSLFAAGDFPHPRMLVVKIAAQQDGVSSLVWRRLPVSSRSLLQEPGASADGRLRALVEGLNQLLKAGPLFEPGAFNGILLSDATKAMANSAAPAQGEELLRFNRLLLEDAYRGDITRSSSPRHVWLAFGLTLIAVLLEVYFGWWNTFLRSANELLAGARYNIAGYGLQLVIAAGLLLAGGGLLSLPAGSLVGNLVQRLFSRGACLRLLGSPPPGLDLDLRAMFALLWPNTWRTGVQFVSQYLGSSLPTLLFAGLFGAAALAPYAVSQQIMATCVGLATVWMQVKWPQVGQLRARRDFASLRKLLQQRFRFQVASYVVLAAAGVLLGPDLLKWIGSGKQLLPFRWLWVLALAGLLDMMFIFWGTLLSMENRIPTLWPLVATNCATVLLFIGLVKGTPMRDEALVLAPLLTGGLFNYWYWHFAGAKSIDTNFVSFLFRRQGEA